MYYLYAWFLFTEVCGRECVRCDRTRVFVNLKLDNISAQRQAAKSNRSVHKHQKTYLHLDVLGSKFCIYIYKAGNKYCYIFSVAKKRYQLIIVLGIIFVLLYNYFPSVSKISEKEAYYIYPVLVEKHYMQSTLFDNTITFQRKLYAHSY